MIANKRPSYYPSPCLLQQAGDGGLHQLALAQAVVGAVAGALVGAAPDLAAPQIGGIRNPSIGGLLHLRSLSTRGDNEEKKGHDLDAHTIPRVTGFRS